MKKLKFILLCLFLVLGIFWNVPLNKAQASRGIVIQTKQGNKVKFYTGSHALLIGVSNYIQGWPDLNSVGHDLQKVENVLQNRGFQVRTVLNPDSKKLRWAFNSFINEYGFEPDNRLLFFYSGHGHTRDKGRKGYLVPADAPDPREDEKGFLRKALTMDQILAWSRRIEAKHALFLFDSCFSGAVFKAKDLPSTPPDISRATSLPVRQFVTAGDAGEAVPAKSVFTPAFVDALKYSWADLNQDDYISGTELGLFLQKKVSRYTEQSPQYGKIRDYELSRGDFVFLALDNTLVEEGASSSKDKGKLNIRTDPARARIEVNGQFKGKSPIDLSGLKPGNYIVMAEKDGYESQERQVRVRSGRTASVQLYLDKMQKTGRLYVYPRPRDARVRIMNITPAYYDGIELEPGQYEIRVDRQGYESVERIERLSAGEDLDVYVELERIKRSRKKEVLFYENFDTDLDKWKIAGAPKPSIVNYEGNPAPSFCTKDDLNYGGWAVSRQTFDYRSGLIISLDIKPGNADYPDQRHAVFRLLRDNTLYTDGPRIRKADWLIHVRLTADNFGTTPGWGKKTPGPWISFKIRYEKSDNDWLVEEAEEIPVKKGSGWHNLIVRVLESRKVEFYLDKRLIYRSDHALPSKSSKSVALGLGVRLCYHDNIKVIK
ncbi:hypothetical protein AKJ60_00125 [candidate division MSBL1 archaeon SCGC-AAA385M11]|nr:hypothetical protein AKJ60_00125 [candidate division MSBL1 archaeon SCGC-AAA385M11]